MLDIIVVIILILFLLYGIRTGLVRMALRMGSVLLSILLAWMLYPVVSDILSNFFLKGLSEMIRVNYIEPNLSGMLGSADNVPAFLQGFLQSGAEAAMQSAAETMANNVAELILNVAAFLIVFLLSRLILLLLTHVLDIITRLPLIKQCNKLGGGVLGLLEGGLAVYMILALTFLVAPIRDSEVFQQQVQNSVITRQMYNDNIIIKMVAPNAGTGAEESV
uniref:Colicin V production protein n=1 Tax=uncultured Bacillota bacterium TaxID=344338 RepID=A0A650F4K0_9FIRM|nr:hypothetical protein Firmicute1046_0910 [uncultured Firmicutes bacterium]